MEGGVVVVVVREYREHFAAFLSHSYQGNTLPQGFHFVRYCGSAKALKSRGEEL